MSYINRKSPVINRAKGAYLYGSRNYIDMCCGNGTHIMGHCRPVIKNTLYAAPCAELEDFVDTFQTLAGFKQTVLCNTGSEATMRAVRIARSYTGKDKIALFEGSWHGSADWSLTCKGVTKAVKDDIIWLPYDLSCLDIIRKYKNELAMVFIEPVQGSNPRDSREFLLALRGLTGELGILFGLDEVITGFRLGYGGAIRKWRIDADLATYGKSLGGGLPIGAVGVRKGIEIDTTLGGSFSGNPATISAGRKFLSEILKTNPYPHINEMGQLLRDKIKIKGAHMMGIGSFNRLIFTDKPIKSRAERDKLEDTDLKDKFYRYLLRNGVFVGVNGLWFTSSAHTRKIINKVINVCNNFGCRTNAHKK